MDISVKWLGHASFEIKAGNKTIYIDPYEGEYKERADLLLISHSHDDHCNPLKIKKIIDENTLVIAPADCVSKIGGKVKSLKKGFLWETSKWKLLKHTTTRGLGLLATHSIQKVSESDTM
jgi:L-ascorbate metabolism protein UlaG (beta-lactamase superfamily)